MADRSRPVFVRLPEPDAERLDRAAASSGLSKRYLVTQAVREHLAEDGLAVGRVALRESAPEVLTLQEAAAFLRLDEGTLERCAKNGELPGRRFAGEWRFSRDALLAALGEPGA
jgi:excisionase family DNA binding protein